MSGPPAISVVGLMQIVFALGLDVLFEGPSVPLVTLAGIALVLAPTGWMMAGSRAGRACRFAAKRIPPRELLQPERLRFAQARKNISVDARFSAAAVLPGRARRRNSVGEPSRPPLNAVREAGRTACRRSRNAARISNIFRQISRSCGLQTLKATLRRFRCLQSLTGHEEISMLNRKLSVAVLGAGHGGLAVAGYLAQQGHLVALWNRSEERILPVAETRGIHLTSPGADTVHAPIALATCNMAAAVSNCGSCWWPCRLAPTLRGPRPADLRDGQTVLLVPGRTGGALEFRGVLRQAGCRLAFCWAKRTRSPSPLAASGRRLPSSTGPRPKCRPPRCPPIARRSCRPRAALPADAPPGTLGAAYRIGQPRRDPAPGHHLAERRAIQSGDPFDFYCDGVTPS